VTGKELRGKFIHFVIFIYYVFVSIFLKVNYKWKEFLIVIASFEFDERFVIFIPYKME